MGDEDFGGSRGRAGAISVPLADDGPGAAPLVIGPQHTRRGHLFGSLVPQGGDLVRAAERLQPGDRRVRHVDRVRGAERLGHDVAHARHLEDHAGGAACDHPGARGRRL